MMEKRGGEATGSYSASASLLDGKRVVNFGDLLVSDLFYNLFFSGGETHLNLPPNQRGVTGSQSNMTTNDDFDLIQSLAHMMKKES